MAEQLQLVSTPRGESFATGWVKRPAAVAAVLKTMAREGKPATFEAAAPRLMSLYASTDDPYFAWDAEKTVLGKILDSWDQGQVGTCVSFGYGRGVQDLLLNEIASGEREKWPGYQVATEPIYGGSRVEVGGGGISGDGSVGAWAARFVNQWGVLVRKVYQLAGQTWDLTTYSEQKSRDWGDRGVPDPLEPEAKLHPVTAVALVTTMDGLWAALGSKKSVPVCSDQGFTMTRDSAGYCQRSGSWAHCMLYRARFVHPTRGKSVVIQNSWNDYLDGQDQVNYVRPDGTVGIFTLPMGCFCVELSVTAEALREQDTFALAGFKGWEADPVPPPGPGPTPPPPTNKYKLRGMAVLDKARFGGSLTCDGTKGWLSGTAALEGSQFTGTIDPVAAPLPPQLAGLSIPPIVLLLLREYGPIVLPIILADLAAGKKWGEIVIDVVKAILGERG